MSPQEVINELPEQKQLALIDRMTPRDATNPQSAWAFESALGWINLEPEDFNEREERK